MKRKYKHYTNRLLFWWTVPLFVATIRVNYRIRQRYPEKHLQWGRPWLGRKFYDWFGWSVNWR